MCPEAKKLLRILKAAGWEMLRGHKSGHLQFVHPTKKGRVTLPQKNIKRNIIKSVFKQAGIKGSIDDFKNGRI